MKVKTDRVPKTELIANALTKIDFKDTFSTTNHIDNLELITNKIFGKTPRWVQFLFKIRGIFAKILGLKHVAPNDINRNYEVGGFIGFFMIYTISENELLLGADDKHLKFRVNMLNTMESNFNIKVTTLVEYNNKMGRIYMFFVAPFHKIVVKSMVKQAYNK